MEKGGNIKMEVKEMFTYIKLKNFMSFNEVIFDFRNGKNGAKKFVTIYGENGSGKSNFVNSIDLLCRSIDTLGHNNNFDNILAIKDKLPQDIIELFYDQYNILSYTKKCRMIESDEDTLIEYGFQIDNHEGYYTLSFGDRFLYEKLYYFTGKQRGTIYEISSDINKINISFSNKLFKDNKLKEELEDQVNKYWGKHTFLSILQNERKEKNETYLNDRILPYIFDVLDMIKNIALSWKKSSIAGTEKHASEPVNVMHDLANGKIDISNKDQLDCSEKILNDFFTQAYADIKKVYYEKDLTEDEIIYRLYVKKMIGGKIRTVNFNYESAGTQHILEIIRSLLGAFCGVTVVYDEIDNGIHDLLLKNVLLSMIDNITGQLIVTTHNTLILETINIKSAYIINVDYLGNKEVKCLDQYPRIQGTNNPRSMYLKGLFGGVPIVDIIDYDEIINELSEDALKGRD